jgi:hypothetical protein
VPGLLVDDVGDAVERLTALGVARLTEPETAGGRTWRRYRAPDANVYEMMVPRRPWLADR